MSRKNVDSEKVSTVMVGVFNFLKRYRRTDYTISEVILGIQGALSILVMRKAREEGKWDLIEELLEAL